MGFSALIGLLSPIFTDLIKRIFPDPEKQAEANIELQTLIGEAQVEAYKAEAAENEAKKDIITTEMHTNWAGQWRAYLMMICIAIVGYNWIIVSLLNAFLSPLGFPITSVQVPPELWTLVTVGLGGYIGKETVQSYSNNKLEQTKVLSAANDAAFFAKLRNTMFKQGLTQEQVEVFNEALKARDGE
jgi:hypothetical protein